LLLAAKEVDMVERRWSEVYMYIPAMMGGTHGTKD
jgi:hypothetical protein